MKKKRNFLTIISSILGVFVICGAFCCSLFLGSNKKTSQTNAEDETLFYAYDYVYRIDKYHVMFGDGDTQLVPPSEFIYKAVQYSLSYRFECFYGQNGEYSIKFSEMAFNDLYAHYKSTYSYTTGEEYYNFDESADFFFDNSSFDYTNYRSILTNINNFINTYLEWNFSYNASTQRYSLVLKMVYGVFQNGSLPPSNIFTFTLLTTDFTDYHTGSNADFSVRVPFITNFNPYEVVGRIDTAIDAAFNDGVSGGAQSNYEQGYEHGNSDGYALGYTQGLNEGESRDEVVTSIFSGILQVALVPINFFLAIFNFEILGINLSAFVRAIFTVVLTIIVLKTVLGKGGGSSDN